MDEQRRAAGELTATAARLGAHVALLVVNQSGPRGRAVHDGGLYIAARYAAHVGRQAIRARALACPHGWIWCVCHVEAAQRATWAEMGGGR
jgi:hypothetical protein